MVHHEFHHILESIDSLSPEQMRQLRRELDGKLAVVESNRPAQAPAEAGRDALTEESSIHEPVWKRIIENMKTVPDEVFDRIPDDSSVQLDHYLYGTPKRPTT